MDQEKTKSQKNQKKKFPVWLIIVICLVGLAVIVGIIVIATSSATSPVTKPVETQLTLLKNGDMQGAYNLTSKEFQATVTFDKFKEALQQFTILTKNKSHSVTQKSITGNTGTVTESIVAADGTPVIVEYNLVNENGTWKILNIGFGTGAPTTTTTAAPTVTQ